MEVRILRGQPNLLKYLGFSRYRQDVTGNIQLTTFGFSHVPELPETLVYAPETDAGDPQADAAVDPHPPNPSIT